jgi:hypothetical protein
MRLGRVEIVIGYTIDLDNYAMVEAAKKAVFTDLDNMGVGINHDVYREVRVGEVSMPTEGDIPSWLSDID